MVVQEKERIIYGTPICRGIAIGRLFFLNRNELRIFELTLSSDDIEREIERYRQALSRSKQDLKRLQKQLEVESAVEGILILDAQLEMLQDPLLTTDIENEIRFSNKNAEYVFQKIILDCQDRFHSLEDSFFIERFKDLQDLSHRILSYLYESNPATLNDVPPHSIVYAQELTATDTAEAKAYYVEAFLTENGGATSHAAIVAKAKGIPYVTNISMEFLKETIDQVLIVDGRTGEVILNPASETLEKYKTLKMCLCHQTEDLAKIVKWPAETFDGFNVRLSANLEMTHEIDLIHQFGGQGIGLFRSEYIFLPKTQIPSEEDQFQIYSQIVEKMKGLPVVIRTFDFGGDKASLHQPLVERNPFLGGRAIRFFLKEQGLFKTQLRAILRASELGDVSLLFPMISTLSELREAKKMVYEVQEELQMPASIRIGCMIEVPSAALIADHFAKECDFLSIGTNDLVQYSLAIDRSDQQISSIYEPTDPSVIRLIKAITRAANQAQIPVAVCGEMASDPRFVPLLLGLGIQELSVAPRYLPFIKNVIRHTSIVEAVTLAEKVLHLKTAPEVFQLLCEEYQKIMPQDLFYNV